MATNECMDTLLNKIRDNIDSCVKLDMREYIIEKPRGKDIGKQIAYYRKLKGWKQEDLAEKLNVSRSCIARYENHPIKLVNIQFLKEIFRTLQITNKVELPEYEEFIIKNQQEQLKKILVANKLNAHTLSKIIDVDDSNVKRWIDGKSVMSKASFKKMKTKFNI